MKKKDRLEIILQLTKNHQIETQEELQHLLAHEGVLATQSTLSRDIRELQLIKERSVNGQLIYKAPPTKEENALAGAMHDYGLSVARAQFMVVVKTNLATADILANIIDDMDAQDILGTVAGADTLMIICQDEKTALAWETMLQKLID